MSEVRSLWVSLKAKVEQWLHPMRQAKDATDKVAGSVLGVEEGTKKMTGVADRGLKGVARGFDLVRNSAAGGVKSVEQIGGSLLQSFAYGGPLALGIAALGTGLGYLIGRTNASAQAAVKASEEYKKWFEESSKRSAVLRDALAGLDADLRAMRLGLSGEEANEERKAVEDGKKILDNLRQRDSILADIRAKEASMEPTRRASLEASERMRVPRDLAALDAEAEVAKIRAEVQRLRTKVDALERENDTLSRTQTARDRIVEERARPTAPAPRSSSAAFSDQDFGAWRRDRGGGAVWEAGKTARELSEQTELLRRIEMHTRSGVPAVVGR